MNQSIKHPSQEFLKRISNIFHPLEDGSFFINHNCFLVSNQTVKTNQIYLLFDYSGNSVSRIIPFSLEDVLIVGDFIMVVGIDIVSGEELGRNEYLVDNEGCSFKLVDFDYLKDLINKSEVKHYCA